MSKGGSGQVSQASSERQVAAGTSEAAGREKIAGTQEQMIELNRDAGWGSAGRQ